MSEGLARTLATALDAASISALLRRAAKAATSRPDVRRLEALAERYADYAEALRESVAPLMDAGPPSEDQQLML